MVTVVTARTAPTLAVMVVTPGARPVRSTAWDRLGTERCASTMLESPMVHVTVAPSRSPAESTGIAVSCAQPPTGVPTAGARFRRAVTRGRTGCPAGGGPGADAVS